jgi:hypothetical protein
VNYVFCIRHDFFSDASLMIQGQKPLTAADLAAASHRNEQKQILGERLFPLISAMFPDLAGKIGWGLITRNCCIC